MGSSRFHLPLNTQASSPLFCLLPAELRTIILQYSLSEDEVVVSRARQDRRNADYYELHSGNSDHESFAWIVTQQQTPQSDPPILRVCQRLRREALSVFYQEKRLEILWSPGNVRPPLDLWSYEPPRPQPETIRYCCDILDGSVPYTMDAEAFQIGNDELNMQPVSPTSSDQDNKASRSRHNIPYLDLQAHWLRRLAPIVRKFKKFHLRVELIDLPEESCLVMCRALRHILEGCDVTVSIYDLTTYEGMEEVLIREEWLRYFRVLRCKSLEFLGREEMYVGCAQESIDDVVDLVTSSEPVQDTFAMWKSLRTSAFAPGPSEPFYQEFNELMSLDMWEAAREYDLQMYKDWRSEYFEILADKGFDQERLRQMLLENSQTTHSK